MAISHPDGDYQRISGAQVAAAFPTFFALQLGGFGLTEGGSSGAPWMSAPGLVVGLHSVGNSKDFINPCSALAQGLITAGGSWFSAIYPSISNYLEDCNFAVSSQSATFPAVGGSGSLGVTANGSCSWGANSNAAWITITSGTSGTGNGTVNFTVQANTGTVSRTGTLTVAGKTVTIIQAGLSGCAFTLLPFSVNSPASGTTGSFDVQATVSCQYTATSNAAWISVTGFSGSLTNYRVDANTGPNGRTGTITINGASAVAPVNFTVFQSGLQTGNQSGLRFVSLPPCRLMETRAQYNFEGRTGSFGPPSLNAGETRTLNLPLSSVCQVPSTAKAYVVNVTLIPKTTTDFVTVFPAGETRPNVWTVRSPDGQIVANSAIVKAGTNGGISVYVSDAADMLIDISGYFTDNTAISNLAYYPVNPCRVIDTRALYRSPAGPFGPPSMTAGQTRHFQFPATPYCSIPSGASAYSVTLTAVPPQSLPYLTSWPTGGSQPNVSSINSFAGRVLANNIIVPASSNGSIDVFAYAATDFIMDINGYFAPDNGNGLFYFPVTQCRVSDSRGNGFTGAFGGPIVASNTARTIPVTSATTCSGIPANAQAYAISATAIPGGSPMPFLTMYASGAARPNASMLNAFEGQTVTNTAIIPASGTGALDVYAYQQTHVVLDLSGYFGR